MTQNCGTSSSSWISPQAGKKSNLERLQNNASHIGILRSPFFPSNLNQFLLHEAEWSTMRVQDMNEKLMAKIMMSTAENFVAVNVEHSTDKEDVAKFAYTAKWKGKSKMTTSEGSIQEIKGDRKMFSVLAEETTIWKPNYILLPERRDPTSGARTRSSWPEQSELKAEGEHRLAIFGERRLPLPRLDRYSQEAVIAKVTNGAAIKELARVKGADISWYEKDLVGFMGLDRLESIDRERTSTGRMWSNEGVATPARPAKDFKRTVTPNDLQIGNYETSNAIDRTLREAGIPDYGEHSRQDYPRMAGDRYA